MYFRVQDCSACTLGRHEECKGGNLTPGHYFFAGIFCLCIVCGKLKGEADLIERLKIVKKVRIYRRFSRTALVCSEHKIHFALLMAGREPNRTPVRTNTNFPVAKCKDECELELPDDFNEEIEKLRPFFEVPNAEKVTHGR